MEKFLLTSAGIGTSELKKAVLEHVPQNAKIAIIATDVESEKSRYYTDPIIQGFASIGLHDCEIIDFTKYKSSEMSRFDVFYICGGNTFKILQLAKQANLKQDILQLFERGGLCIGVSAGSIILAPNINVANEIRPDLNEIGLTDLSGLDMVSDLIAPHYDLSHEQEVLDFENKYKVNVLRMTDTQGLLIIGKEKTQIK
jgi:dipeptidase E